MSGHWYYIGKSSLLNLLAKRPAAIVSPVAGTTRDVVEVRMDFDGISCIVSDTAGIRISQDRPSDSFALNTASNDDIFCSADAIEYEGMRRARDVYLASHVKILICDASDAASVENTMSLLDTLQTMHASQSNQLQISNDANITDPDNLLQFIHKPVVRDGMCDQSGITFVIFNKIDLFHDSNSLGDKIRKLILENNLPTSAVSFLSCSTGTGLEELEASLSSAMKNLVSDGGSGSEDGFSEGQLITRTRHRMHVLQCVKHLETFLEEELLMDTAAEELRY